MTAHLIGTRTVGGCLPSTLEALAALDAAVAVSMPKIQAEIAGALELQARLSLSPPSLTGSLQILAQLSAALNAAVAAPSVGFDLSMMAALVGKLQVDLGSLQAQLAFSASLGATLGTSGVHLYAYEGQANSLGSSFSSELSDGFPGGQPTDQAYAFLLGTSSPQTRVALEAVFGSSLSVS